MGRRISRYKIGNCVVWWLFQI